MKRMRSISPLAGIMIILMFMMAFQALLYLQTNLTSLNTQNIAIQNNETTSKTNELAEDIGKVFFSQNRTNTIIDRVDNLSNQILEFERVTEESRQNQTDRLLPIFFRQFNQTDILANTTNDLRTIIPEAANAINNVTEAVNFLAENFGPDTGYLERENFQYGQANETNMLIKNMSQNLERIADLLES